MMDLSNAFVYLVQASGWMATPLAVLAILATVATVGSAWRLGVVRLRSRAGRRRLDSVLEQDRLHDLAETADRPVDLVLAAAVPYLGTTPAQAASALELAARREARRLRRGLDMLHGVVLLAPVCGLCGTVVAFAMTFPGLGSDFLSSPSVVAAGLWEAFNSTVLGFAVAIPAQLALTILCGWAERSEAEIEDAVHRFLLHLALARTGR